MPVRPSRLQALGVCALIWAAIYLPAFGTLEIKGEEGRRILPAVTMLETGHWIVPSVGGVDYFSKPPLINWAIAAAIRLSGRQDEWAARAPSVTCVLALGLGTVWLLADWLGAGGALVAAVFMLTGIGMMEKGRLAEIEAMYICLFGLAFISWLTLWCRPRAMAAPDWLAWTVPWIFLGLGLLTKGPLALVFFYALVIGILLAAGRLRELWSWPHLAGIVLMATIFCAWVVPYLHLTAAERVGQVWSNQMANRLEFDEGFRPGWWLLNIPRGLVNFLPWAVLLPLLWRRQTMGSDHLWAVTDLAILRGGRWAMTACFVIVSLAPGGLPRYTLPLLVPASVLLGLVLAREWNNGGLPRWLPLVWTRTIVVCLALAGMGAVAAASAGRGGWRWLAAAGLLAACAWLAGRLRQLLFSSSESLPQLAIFSAVVMAVLTMDYVIGGVPRQLGKERLRPLAVQLNKTIAPQAPLYAYQPGFLPLFFYLHPAARYVQRVENMPTSVHYLLVWERDIPFVEKQLEAAGFSAQRSVTLAHLSRGTWCVLHLEKSG